MLHRLIDWAERNDLVVPPGFKVKAVRWALVFDAGGRFLLVRELGDVETKRNRGAHLLCPNLELGEMKRGGTGTRHFLVDNAAVAALVGCEDGDDKAQAKHQRFVSLLADAASAVPALAALSPVAEALSDEATLATIRQALEDKGATATENVSFEVHGADPRLLVEGDAWHEWYQEWRAGLAAESGGGGPKMRCVVSGELVVPLATHPKITGLADVGGLSMGDVLPAFKQESFRSYGLDQAANSAMSDEVAASYAAALNRLIRRQSVKLAGNRVVYWFDRPLDDDGDDPLAWIVDPPETVEGDARARARALLTAIRDGARPDLAGNRYFALTMAANSGRVVLRDWMEGSFPELLRNVTCWFENLQVVGLKAGGQAPPPKLWAVLGSLVRDLDDLPDPLVARVWRVAARREPIPRQAMVRALERFRIAVVTDQPVRTAGVGLLKAYRLRNLGDPDMQPGLNEDHPSSAYHCGRLMAVLDYLQYKALGDVGAGVVQRYYAAASATPSLVLGRLLRLAQFHLGKLSPGERRSFEYRIGQVTARIGDGFPPPLSLEDQGLFALGYYHQKAYRPPQDETGDDGSNENETSEETA